MILVHTYIDEEKPEPGARFREGGENTGEAAEVCSDGSILL